MDASKQVQPRKAASWKSNPIPLTGFVRLPQILGTVPVSRSSWWAGVRSGRFPKAVKLGPRTTAWRAEDIHALIASFAE